MLEIGEDLAGHVKLRPANEDAEFRERSSFGCGSTPSPYHVVFKTGIINRIRSTDCQHA